MKYLKYIIICIILLPTIVYALEEEIIIKCPDNIIKNEEFDCEIIGSAPYKVSAIEYEFGLPNYITKKDFKVDPIWEGNEENNLILLYTDENKESPFNIGVLTLSSSKDISYVDITHEYILFGDEDYKEHYLVEKKDVNDLKSKKEKVDNKKNNNYIYVIIVLIIACVIMGVYIVRRKRVKR